MDRFPVKRGKFTIINVDFKVLNKAINSDVFYISHLLIKIIAILSVYFILFIIKLTF